MASSRRNRHFYDVRRRMLPSHAVLPARPILSARMPQTPSAPSKTALIALRVSCKQWRDGLQQAVPCTGLQRTWPAQSLLPAGEADREAGDLAPSFGGLSLGGLSDLATERWRLHIHESQLNSRPLKQKGPLVELQVRNCHHNNLWQLNPSVNSAHPPTWGVGFERHCGLGTGGVHGTGYGDPCCGPCAPGGYRGAAGCRHTQTVVCSHPAACALAEPGPLTPARARCSIWRPVKPISWSMKGESLALTSFPWITFRSNPYIASSASLGSVNSKKPMPLGSLRTVKLSQIRTVIICLNGMRNNFVSNDDHSGNLKMTSSP